MEKPCLNDKDEYPDDEVLSRALGRVKPAWDAFLGFIQERYPAFSGQWRYYNDGKSWLYKLVNKKKTICWVSVYPHVFKTAFYFPDKAEGLIAASPLGKAYIDQFVHGKRYGKIRGIRVDIRKTTDLKATKALIKIKEQVR